MFVGDVVMSARSTEVWTHAMVVWLFWVCQCLCDALKQGCDEDVGDGRQKEDDVELKKK